MVMYSVIAEGAIAQSVIVTPSWMDLYGIVNYWDGKPMEAGAVIRAYDPESTLCGMCSVSTEGVYGFMAVYGDDPFTTDVDEGASEGDRLTFEINGTPALFCGIIEPIWSSGTMRLNVCLVSLETAVQPARGQSPYSFELNQNYPNPFNPETMIEYRIPKASFVKLMIYNIVGQNIATLVDMKQSMGVYSVKWDGKDDAGRRVSSGVYFYRLEADGFVKVKKLAYLR
jgi:hypothetical protein